MKLSRSVVLFFTFIINTCVSRVPFTISKPDYFPHFVEETVKGLISCYGNQTNEFGLAGKPFRSLLGTNQFQSVVLIDNTAMKVGLRRERRYKLKLFVVAVSSSTEFLHILGKIKESVWWSHMAAYLIINWPPTPKNGCSNALEFLQIAWKMNLINAHLVCFPQAKKPLIYSYNPYTKKAPESWKLINTPASKNDQQWTLYEREYHEDSNVCDGLDFDKTADLSGYKIRASVKTTFSWKIDFNKTGVDSLSGRSGITNRILFKALHANAELTVHNNSEGAGYVDKNGKNILEDVVNGNSDLVLNLQFIRNVQNYTISKICGYVGISILTQFNGKKSQLDKIVSVIDVSSRYGVFIVILITFIFFKHFRGLEAMPAVLNLLRLISNSSLPKVPKNVPARIYLSAFFIFLVTVQAIYQGQLSSLLTKTVSLPNVNTLQDLANKDSKIYGHKWWAYLFDGPAFVGRYVADEDFQCTDHVLNDTSGACVAGRALLSQDARKLKLHLAEDNLATIPLVYVIREDWPLEQRFNMAIEKLIHTGTFQHRYISVLEKESAIHKYHAKLDERKKYEVITLEELAFVFWMLVIGLGCATVVFILEMGIDQIRKRNTKVHNKIRISHQLIKLA